MNAKPINRKKLSNSYIDDIRFDDDNFDKNYFKEKGLEKNPFKLLLKKFKSKEETKEKLVDNKFDRKFLKDKGIDTNPFLALKNKFVYKTKEQRNPTEKVNYEKEFIAENEILSNKTRSIFKKLNKKLKRF